MVMGHGDGEREGLVTLTLVRDLHDGPEDFMSLLSFVGRGLGIFHLVGKFEEGVLDVLEALGWRFAVSACAADGWHDGHLIENVVLRQRGGGSAL